jgi:hypothetical protein
MNKMKTLQLKENQKEILFMQILHNIANQYLELNPEDALNFVLDVMSAMDFHKIKIK